VVVVAGCAIGKTPRPAVSPALIVDGAVDHPLKLQADDLLKMLRTTVQATEHHGVQATYKGVLLPEILKAPGAPLGERLRGRALATSVVASAQDRYQVLFVLPELDPSFTDQTVLVAGRINGKPLPDVQGLLRIIALHEKRAAKWIRMVQAIKVHRLVE